MFNISQQTKTLLYFSSFSVALVVARVLYTDRITYVFLLWNLFLAAIPLALTKGLSEKPTYTHKIYNLGVLLTWVLFFPNAPYIFTDLFHLKTTSSGIIWYDTTLILSMAWTGMIFGYLSLVRIERFLKTMLSEKWALLTVHVMLFISAFGVYIGRYLRFNSWDVVSDPLGLLLSVGEHVFDPFTHPRTWGMTIVFGLFLSLLYASLRTLKRNGIDNAS